MTGRPSAASAILVCLHSIVFHLTCIFQAFVQSWIFQIPGIFTFKKSSFLKHYIIPFLKQLTELSSSLEVKTVVSEAFFGIDVELAVCKTNNDLKASRVVLLVLVFCLFLLTNNNDCLQAAAFPVPF